jgi:putative DNA methylase
MIDRRFIEESFPVKEVGEVAARDSGSSPGNIRKLHIWWSRKPLAASRATVYAALTSASANIEEWQQQRGFLIQLCKGKGEPEWQVLKVARETILKSNDGHAPRILDPFSGGGSYPLEALRLGCEVYASDYNPVAVLILKAVLEFPRQFGSPVPEPPCETSSLASLFDNDVVHGRMVNPLLAAVRHWGDKVLNEVREQIAEFYPAEMDGSIPVGYLWARTIPCQNPSCSASIPLMSHYWLVRGEKTRVALFPEISSGVLVFRIIGHGYEPWPDGYDPGHGAINKGVVACPLCGPVIDNDTTRRLFDEGKAGQSMMAVILQSHNI